MRKLRLRQGRALALVLLLAPALSSGVLAQNPDPATGRALLREFAGSDDTDAFLRHPKVGPELQRLLGAELPHLMLNINVRGSVDVIGGDLSVAGNAPHMGTEEEGVVCVSFYNVRVTAAIFSKGSFTAYSNEGTYDGLPRCIKDWITQAKSAHIDRFEQPPNVRVVAPK
jgi:hypothetical protein